MQKIKFVYCISSDDDDNYLEQLLLSVYSLRKYNKDATVELVIDQRTETTLTGKRSEIYKYFSQKHVVNLPHFNKVQTSRWLKTSIRSIVKGDYLFLDNDTIICDRIDINIPDDIDIAAVYDGHHLISNESKFLLQVSRRDGWGLKNNMEYFNSGVFLVRDTAKSAVFYNGWHENWEKGLKKHNYFKDQSALALTNEQFSYMIKPLGGEWNCQVMSNGLPYLHKAKVIHYFANTLTRGYSTTYRFLDNELFAELKKTMQITPEIDLLIENARGAFADKSMVVSGFEKELVVSDFANICRRYPSLFRFLNSICRNSIMLRHHLKVFVGA